MSGRAVRSRVLELRQARESARRGRDVLEQKLELLRTELQRRVAARDRQRAEVNDALGAARALLHGAILDLGREAVAAASLAQPATASVELRVSSGLGVERPVLRGAVAAFAPRYGPAATSESLDKAGASWTALLPKLYELAEQEAAAAAVARALARTARRVGALDKVLLPSMTHEARSIAFALEEDERDEAARRRVWLRR